MVLAREVYLGTSDGFELELPLHLLSLTWVPIVRYTSLWSAFVRILSPHEQTALCCTLVGICAFV